MKLIDHQLASYTDPLARLCAKRQRRIKDARVLNWFACFFAGIPIGGLAYLLWQGDGATHYDLAAMAMALAFAALARFSANVTKP